MKLQWNDEARNFIEGYGLDIRFVVDAIRVPQSVSLDPRSNEVGYEIRRFRRGDVEAVVGFREPEFPTVLFVRLATPGDEQGPKRSPGGASGSSIPPTVAEMHRRMVMAGYSIQNTGPHPKVVTSSGKVLMSMPKTPSDRRSLANTWREFVRLDHARKQREEES